MPKQNFSDMVSLQPQFGPLSADEEPTPEETRAFNAMYTEVLEFIHGPKSESVLGTISNAPELYQGIGNTAFQILLAVKQNMEKDGKPVEPAALWGEGGAIQSTVDELFQLARAARLPEADNPDMFSAAMFETYRLAGEYIQNANEDDAINEAQELLVDVETSTDPEGGMPEGIFNEVHQGQLDGAYENSLAARQAMEAGGPQGAQAGPEAQGGMPPEAMMGQEQPMPQEEQPMPAGNPGMLGGGF